MCGLQYIPLNLASKFCFSSNVAWIILQPLSVISAVESDDRPCSEKLEGPFDSKGLSTSKIVHLTADENDTVLVKCRISCQDLEGEYIPFASVDITEDGRNYDNPSDGRDLYELTLLTNDSCSSERNVTEFEYIYQITAKSESVDRSIVRCELRYVPGRNLPEQTCYSTNFAWIKLRGKPTTTSNAHPTSKISERKIPDKASIPSVTILTILVVLFGATLLLISVIMINRRYHCFFGRREEMDIQAGPDLGEYQRLRQQAQQIEMPDIPGYIPDGD